MTSLRFDEGMTGHFVIDGEAEVIPRCGLMERPC
jgi:hypothetical protein